MRFLIIVSFLLVGPSALAQDRCDWQIRSVSQDELRGSIVVQTRYKIDGRVVYNGETRYDETSGSARHVVKMVHKDIDDQCAFLLHTPKIPQNFYNRPDLIQKKKDTKSLLKSLRRIEGKKGAVSK